MKFKKTMTAAVVAAVVGCGGFYVSSANAAIIVCANGAGKVGYSFSYPKFSVQARSNKGKTVRAVFFNGKGQRYTVAGASNGAQSGVYVYPFSRFNVRNSTEARKSYMRCNP